MNSLSGAWAAVVLALFLSLPSVTLATELPKDATVLDGDIVFYSWPYPSVSPDGQWVAYISQGYVCVCNVTAPARRRIMEMPNSWTWPKFVAGSGESKLTGNFQSLSHGRGRDEYRKVLAQVTKSIYGLVWKYDSTGFVFGVQDQAAGESNGYFTTVDGTISKIVHVDANTKTRTAIVGTLSRDGRFLVSPGSMQNQGIDRPLIWNISENKPRATGFLYLIPSATSDRWLGVEKDSQQLVIADKDFEVVQRFNETRSEKTFGFELQWSPDEKFIIWRNQIGFDYYSNWEGFWMDLTTGEKKELVGHYMGEQILFTGRGGEFVRCGQDGVPSKLMSGSQVTGAHLTIDPGGKGQPKDIWRTTVDPSNRNPALITNLAGNGPLRMSPDANLFAVVLPKMDGNRVKGLWHLMSREGRTWKFPGDDIGEFISPYDLVGFAANGQKIVAFDSSRLFSIPVSSVMTDANLIK